MFLRTCSNVDCALNQPKQTHLIIENMLKEYSKRTKKLHEHVFQRCKLDDLLLSSYLYHSFTIISLAVWVSKMDIPLLQHLLGSAGIY